MIDNRHARIVDSVRLGVSDAYLTSDLRGRRVGVLLVTPDGVHHRYAVVPHPTEVGRVVLVLE